MSSHQSEPVSRPAKLGYCLILLCAAVAALCTATAHASYYKMLLCAGNNGAGGYATATNTASSANPGGIFDFQNHCGSAPDPAGSYAYLRIAENQAAGNAGVGAYGRISWSAPAAVSIAGAGGYTREPNAFNQGWRGRLWAEGYDGGVQNILMQGAGVENGSLGGIGWATTSTFAPHLWPFGYYGVYRRFSVELTCVREAGCERANFNALDANTLALTLSDNDPSRVSLGSAGLLSGQWSRGAQGATWSTSDAGSGIRYERLRVDGAQRHVNDYGASCNLGSSETTHEFARSFAPCPTGGPYTHSFALDTASLPDGAHNLEVCAQDYGQATGIAGSGGESCAHRTIHTDNTPPSAPAGLSILTANPNRYLDRFGASWTLPPDAGSPIAAVHYEIVNSAGSPVMAERTVAGTDPTSLAAIESPKAPGDYRLRAWLEDAVGLMGPVATVPIPHDTTPPAAPQDLSVTAPSTSRTEEGFDVRWRNITDNGSPIAAVHYRVLNGAGRVIVPTIDVEGEDPRSISDLATPQGAGAYTLELWLSDAEGNVGAPVRAPLSYDCERSDVGGGRTLIAGLGERVAPALTVLQGQGSVLTGSLRGRAALAGAPVCVFARTVTDRERDFLGVALTDQRGQYEFVIGAGPSRQLTAIYRPDQREISAQALIETRVAPSFKLGRRIVRNNSFAAFSGRIPGPHNDNVVVVLQVKSGKGWRAFRRYRTRQGGAFSIRYRFTQTSTPTTYVMRAQVRETTGYPYRQGNSRALPLRVVP